MGVTYGSLLLKDGGRLALFSKGVKLRPFIYTIRLRMEIQDWRAKPMDIILGVIAIISFGCTCFAVGYALGKDINKTQK